MSRKVQKKIKYYKTPLEPVWDDMLCGWVVKFENRQGKIPQELNGSFTAKHYCQKAISNFLNKYTVEYID